METNVFGQPENNQPEVVEREGSNPVLITILLVLIVIGGGVLGFLLYRQSQEPAPVLDEVVETVDLQSSSTTPTPANSESNNPVSSQ
jgi:flagellar basal body-associated protein FliL